MAALLPCGPCTCQHRVIRPRCPAQPSAARQPSSAAAASEEAGCRSAPASHLRLTHHSSTRRRDVRAFNRKRHCIPKESRGPDGLVKYETMLVLRPDLSEDGRDVELAKFQSFLEREKAQDIVSNVRSVQPLAYPISGFWDAIYVLFTYSARRSTAVAVQSILSKPTVGQEKQILRFGTFRIA